LVGLAVEIDIMMTSNGDSLVGGRPNVMASMAAVMEQMPIYFQFLQPYANTTTCSDLTSTESTWHKDKVFR
jgi:hypothetical protein